MLSTNHIVYTHNLKELTIFQCSTGDDTSIVSLFRPTDIQQQNGWGVGIFTTSEAEWKQDNIRDSQNKETRMSNKRR